MSLDSEPIHADTRIDRAVSHVKALSSGGCIDPTLRVTLQFHPDGIFGGGRVLASLCSDGQYRSQYETGTSNGSLTAHPGGDRWKWESRIFAGAYDDSPAEDRPKYGALNDLRRSTGASPRFGSAYLRLAAHVLSRTTFCFPDSVYEPRHFGVAERMAVIAAARGAVWNGDPLDQYIEAHVHGRVEVQKDVEAIVLDPCYRGTDIERLARTLPCELDWHGGFRLHTEVLVRHADYRGPEYVRLGRQLAVNGWLTPREIGEAAGRHDPQSLKRLWHYLARFGDSGASGSG